MMNMKTYVLISWIFFGCIFIGACTEKTSNDHSHLQSESKQKYTCSMHPQIVQDHPGICPVCSMDLVPVSSQTSNHITLNDNQVKLANIKTEKVSTKPVGHTHVANGRLANDETLAEKVSARAGGRIDRLFIKETGTMIRKGEPMYELFSEELQTLAQEYILGLEQYRVLGESEPRFKSIMESTEKKLLLYGISKNQIQEIRESGKAKERVTYYSPVSGYVSDLEVSEGQYVQEGQSLFAVQNNNNLWVEAELYPSETALVKVGDQIKVRITGFESEDAVVSFLSPEFRTNTQISEMRAVLKNSSGKYKPGMQAQVMFTSSSREAMAVPLNAIIRDGKGTHLYVKTAPNTFEPRMVKTGSENIEVAEVTEGLRDGEEVVTSGAYLLYSEMVLKKGGEVIIHNH
jgi:membrane fusion protein, copper/silver efflux system